MEELKLWNLDPGIILKEEKQDSRFVLRTCQRTLVLSLSPSSYSAKHEMKAGEEAYIFLLETICGLQSRLLAENEIVGQFKEAYRVYLKSSSRDIRLLAILEKLFKDAKEIRSKYLSGICQKTYASVTRRHFVQTARASHIVVVGSGSLAEDLIHQFKNKTHVSICARNTMRVDELSRRYKLQVIPWNERHTLSSHAFIANSIGHSSILFEADFFREWSAHHTERLFVDLGSPSVIRTELSDGNGVIRLGSILLDGVRVEREKAFQIELAYKSIRVVSFKRKCHWEKASFKDFKFHSDQYKENNFCYTSN